MENFEYNCHYCGKSYVPRRRYVQRYCSTSCRVNAFNRRKKPSPIVPVEGCSPPEKKVKNEQTTNLAGISNAALGNAFTTFTMSVLTPEENKPATKGDLWALMKQQPQQRYLPVYNIPQREDGTKPFYDSVTRTVIYRQNFPPLEPLVKLKK